MRAKEIAFICLLQNIAAFIEMDYHLRVGLQQLAIQRNDLTILPSKM